MKPLHFIIIAAIIFIAAVSESAEPDVDRLIGNVPFGGKFKPDQKSRAKVASIAAKIMKIKGAGSVRIRGDYPGAENADEYLLKSVFMAREIEQQLKPLLKKRFQIFVMSSKYSGEKVAGSNSVDVFFYPRELIVEDIEALRYKSVQQSDRPKEIIVPESQIQEAVQQGYEAVELIEEPLDTDNRVKDSKKMRTQQEREDPAKADALVNRVKARAAERARREAQQSAPDK